ncbi:hypothetical protein AB0K00_54940 [Dactylosporangium sp. NPDC049525]|uniref:hypothetical protein n=1 Tax=Dactylosporangium sp. NPDC049525 TaxID=3154730 RepID=UPI00342A87FC
MPDAAATQFVLVRSRWRAAVPLAVTLVFRALVVAYAVALGTRGTFLVLVILVFGLSGVIGLLALVTTFTAPPAVLTPDGPRVRAEFISPGLTEIAWSDVDTAWIAYYGSQRCLSLLAGARARAYVTPIPEGTVDAAAVVAAVHELSGGLVTVSDTPPARPQSGSPAFRLGGYGRERKTPLLVGFLPWVAILALLPWLMDAPQPWDQPWWPGN